MHFGVRKAAIVIMKIYSLIVETKVRWCKILTQILIFVIFPGKILTIYIILLSITDIRKLQNKLLTGESEEEFKFTSIPITLNPHIKKLYVRNTSLERLDSTLQNYPYLEELRLGRNKIQVNRITKRNYKPSKNKYSS